MSRNPKTVMKEAAALKADLARVKAGRDRAAAALRREEAAADMFARRIVELNKERGR